MKHKSHFRVRNAPSLATPARKVALQAVHNARMNQSYVSFELEKILSQNHLSSEDASFAQLLAFGSTSVLLYLDECINQVLASPKDIKPKVRDALRLSAYELLYLNKSSHAVVDQGVELVRFVSPKATGLANYVLRQLSDLKSQGAFSKDSLTMFEEIGRTFGFPDWLSLRLKKDIGKKFALILMEDSLSPAPIYFTVNSCKAIFHEVLVELEKNGIGFETVDSLSNLQRFPIFKLLNRSQAGLPEFVELVTCQKIIVSDLSAQSIASMTLPEEKPERFLEIGSGRGTKTLLIQSAAQYIYGSQLSYETLEISPAKTELLKQRVQQANVSVQKFHVGDGRSCPEIEDEAFDVVFIDAPCTGVGTLRRHPEIKYRLKEQDSLELSVIGLALLKEASRMLKPKGRLVYATCTALACENEKVISKFCSLAEGKNFKFINQGKNGAVFFKSPVVLQGPDYHFACVLQKN